MATKTPFQYDAAQTQIAIGYENAEFIADQVLPDVSTGLAQEYTYRRYRMRDTLRIPETQLTREGAANEVEYGHDAIQATTDDYGLISVIPVTDIQKAAAAGLANPADYHTEHNMEQMMLQKEEKCASIVFNSDTYETGLKNTLSGTSQWSDTTNSDPITTIMEALDMPFRRPNTMVIGRQAFTKLRLHPKVVSGVQANGSGINQSGVVMASAIAELLEIDRVLVGSAWFDSTPEGADLTRTRLWGKHCALLHLAPISLPNTMTFGFTATTGDPVTYSWFENNRGFEGSWAYKTGMRYRQNICAPEFGYLFSNVIA